MNPLTARCAETELPAQEGAPDWVHLLPAGTIKGRDGRSFLLGDPKSVVAASDLGADLPIDYEHQIDDPAQRPEKGAVPAAGWIKELEVRPDGIWGRVEWTETARNMIAAKEYRYLSPVLVHTKLDSQVVRLLGASLVHRPNLHLKALSSEANPGSELGQIAEALGLPASSNVASILVALQSRLEAQPDPARFVPTEAVVELMRERNATLALMGKREAVAKVERAMEEGFLTPAMKPWAVALCTQDPASFEAFLSSAAPAYAHLFTERRWTLEDVRRTPLDGTAELIAAQLGIDPKSMS